MPTLTGEYTLVINRSRAPFSLSVAARDELVRDKAFSGPCDVDDLRRDDPHLVGVVDRLGARANGPGCDLRVVRVPVNVEIELDGDAEEVTVSGGGYTCG